MKELVLGTAQLGLNYGINNNNGKPSKIEAFKILDYAFNNGINILDTAGAYGDSEKLIGEYSNENNNYFKITTKLPSLKNIDDVQANINKSLENLKIRYIDYYLIHNFNDIIEYKNLMGILVANKKNNIIKNIGISIYSPEELQYIMKYLSNDISIVQIPFNILDNRWLENDLLRKANEKGIKIACRSIYLQGLFFLKEEEIKKISLDAMKYVDYIKKVSSVKNIELKQLLINYVKMQKYIHYVLVGCETAEQLKQNIKEFKKSTILTEDEINDIVKFTRDIDIKIIDPRLWNR